MLRGAARCSLYSISLSCFHSASSRASEEITPAGVDVSNKRSPVGGGGKRARSNLRRTPCWPRARPTKEAHLPPALVPLGSRDAGARDLYASAIQAKMNAILPGASPPPPSLPLSLSLSRGLILKVINKREPYNSFPAVASQRLAGRPRTAGEVSLDFFLLSHWCAPRYCMSASSSRQFFFAFRLAIESVAMRSTKRLV